MRQKASVSGKPAVCAVCGRRVGAARGPAAGGGAARGAAAALTAALAVHVTAHGLRRRQPDRVPDLRRVLARGHRARRRGGPHARDRLRRSRRALGRRRRVRRARALRRRAADHACQLIRAVDARRPQQVLELHRKECFVADLRSRRSGDGAPSGWLRIMPEMLHEMWLARRKFERVASATRTSHSS